MKDGLIEPGDIVVLKCDQYADTAMVVLPGSTKDMLSVAWMSVSSELQRANLPSESVVFVDLDTVAQLQRLRHQ